MALDPPEFDEAWFKRAKVRSAKYLNHIRSLQCLSCGNSPVQAHHLMRAEDRGTSLKTGDNWAVPLCFRCHDSLHRMGNEDRWWIEAGEEPKEWASNQWKEWKNGQAG